MLEIKGSVAGVRKRLWGWDWFCDFAQLVRSLNRISTVPLM